MRLSARPAPCLLSWPRRYSTITTCPVPQPGHSLVSCELHIGAFSGFAQSMNCACTFIWSLVSPDASPQPVEPPLPPPLPLLHCTPKILTVAKPVIVGGGELLMGAPQVELSTGTKY